MAQQTRRKQPHQHMPWASGSRKAPPSGRGRRQTPWTRVRKAHQKLARDHPMVAVVEMVVFGLVTVACLILGLLAENLLYFLAMGLSSLGAVAAARTQHLAQQRKAASTRIPKPPKQSRPSTPPPNQTPSSQAPDPDKVKCTRTGTVAKDCDCAAQHVRTPDGVRKFGGQIGDPIGARKRQTKP